MSKPLSSAKPNRATVRLSTPFHTEVGYCLGEDDYIISSCEIVHQQPSVVLSGEDISRQRVDVVFTDEALNLAFIRSPDSLRSAGFELRNKPAKPGEEFFFLNRKTGMERDLQRGTITDIEGVKEVYRYYHYEMNVPDRGGGGVLIDREDRLAGFDFNGFTASPGGDQRAVSPESIREILKEVKRAEGATGMRCTNCNSLEFQYSAEKRDCSNCGIPLTVPGQWTPYRPTGVSQTIEGMLKQLGFDPALNRRGTDNWKIRSGSAEIHISYHQKSGIIAGEANLCRVVEATSDELYEYLLQKNYSLRHLSFSVRDDRLILSLLIYDRYFTVETGTRLFGFLLRRSDDFDDVLVEEFGAKWLK